MPTHPPRQTGQTLDLCRVFNCRTFDNRQTDRQFMFIEVVANGKSETCRDTETGTLESETETEKFSDLTKKHICDRDRHKI